jgi:hypothetical protein
MEPNIVYEINDTTNTTLPTDNQGNILQNSMIEGNGSEFSLKSIKSQQQDIIHSSFSSLNAIGKSNSINNSNDNNNLNIINDQKSSLNNNNQTGIINSKISNNSDLYDSKDTIVYIFDKDNNINNNQSINLEYSIISNNNIIDKKKVINSNKINYETKLEKIDNKNHINHSNKERIAKNKSINAMIAHDVSKKIKKGFIPFFVKAKGYKVVFFYGEPNSKLKKIIEHYIKIVNGSNEIKNSFYYNKKLIDLESTVGEIKIKPLETITNEIE